MSKRERRQKASDVFANTNFLLGQKGSFAQAFPEIKALKVRYTEHGETGFRGEELRSLSEDTAGEFIDCSNGRCYDGGFALADEIRFMISRRATSGEFFKTCRGNEASPKGRRVYGSCMNYFKGQIEIEYKEHAGEKG